jgi:Leucine-rich repeat (LRR) protein
MMKLLATFGRLSRVTGHTFAELHELEELYLAGNELQTIEPRALTSLKKLRTLDLSDNSLSVLHDSIFQVWHPTSLNKI